MVDVGGRVIAIKSSDDTTVWIFGYGVRVADEVPGSAGGFMGKALVENEIENPCILLDSGKKVYGCECWWGSEKLAQKHIIDKQIVEVDIEEYRKEIEEE